MRDPNKLQNSSDAGRLYDAFWQVQGASESEVGMTTPLNERHYEFVNAIGKLIDTTAGRTDALERTLAQLYSTKLGMSGKQIRNLLPDALQLNWDQMDDHQKSLCGKDGIKPYLKRLR